MRFYNLFGLIEIAIGFSQRKKVPHNRALAALRKTNVAKADACDSLYPSAKADGNLVFSAKDLDPKGL